jgi:hypothetical protein
LRAVWCAALSLAAGAAAAHKASDSYLQVAAAGGRLDVRWDIALRDLDVALDLDSDADGRLTWGEVRGAWPRIEAYASQRLVIEGCPLASAGRSLERRNDGAYAVLHLVSSCTLADPPRISYALFAEVDPTHRGIAKVQREGRQVALSVLEPRPFSAVDRAPTSVASADAGDARTRDAASPPAQAGARSRWEFLAEGVHHIVTGYDHVLFLLCLLLPAVQRGTPAGREPVARFPEAVWPVTGIVTAFTVAHSITLIAAGLGWVRLPSRFVESAIALSIAYVAVENLAVRDPKHRWLLTFFFGLVHGFGFASVLAEIGLPASGVIPSLVSFNVGVELGQLTVVCAVAPILLWLVPRYGQAARVRSLGSVALLVMSSYWFFERVLGRVWLHGWLG